MEENFKDSKLKEKEQLKAMIEMEENNKQIIAQQAKHMSDARFANSQVQLLKDKEAGYILQIQEMSKEKLASELRIDQLTIEIKAVRQRYGAN